MKTTLLFFSLLFFIFQGQAQTKSCKLQGIITDKATKEAIPFVNVILYTNDTVIVAGATTDFEGKYTISNFSAGTYNLEVKSIGYSTYKVEGVECDTMKLVVLNIALSEQQEMLECVMLLSAKPRKTRKFRSSKKMFNNSSFSTNSDTESYNKIEDNSYKSVRQSPLSTFSIDVDRASYSNVRRFINKGTLPPADAVRTEEMINYFEYDYPQPENSDPFAITTEFTDCPWNEKHQLVQIGIKGKEIEASEAPANNLVFLIDVSGSMDSPDKLDLLKSGLHLLVNQLRKEDRVSIVVYAGAAGVVLKPTSGKNKTTIKGAIDQLSAGGSTAGGRGIELAYNLAKSNFIKDGNNRIILATDGDFNVGISSQDGLIKLIEEKRNDDIFLSVLGFGTGNLKDSKMEQIADKGNGNYNYIDNVLEAKKVLVTEIGGTLLTIAKDVKVQAEFNPKHVKGYRLIGYENRSLNDEDFNDDTKDAGELGAGHTVTVLYEIIPASSDEKITSIDDLKYQKDKTNNDNYGDEILTVKFRYKRPKEKKSNLITEVVLNELTPFSNTSDNIRFSAAVAEFGMLLRNSEYKSKSNYTSVIEMAKKAKGVDELGYRAEFIRLVEMVQTLQNGID